MTIPTKIPTLLGILLVVLVVGGVVAGSESFFRTTTTASGSIQPAQVKISNVSDSTFTVSWITQLPATGALSINSSKDKGRVLFDDQDVKEQGKYVTHSVTLHTAQPNTLYEITILSNGKRHLDNGKPFTVHTASLSQTPSSTLEPAFGTIVSGANQPVGGALVYLTIDGGQTLSTISKPSGTWLIPLNLVRTSDFSDYLPITERMTESIVVRAQGLETSALTDTLNDSPVPDMTLGKTYDFRRANAKAPGKDIALRPAAVSPSPAATAVLGATTGTPSNTVALTIPAQNAALPTTLPLIQGTGIPGKSVSIIMGITKPIGGSAIVGSNGLWSYTPTTPLAPGKQSVTISTQDAANKPVAITHMFEILKSGTQVLGDATPSATLTPTITLAPIATDTATPTPESTLTAQPVPTSGNELPTIILLVIGLGLMIGGGVTLMK